MNCVPNKHDASLSFYVIFYPTNNTNFGRLEIIKKHKNNTVLYMALEWGEVNVQILTPGLLNFRLLTPALKSLLTRAPNLQNFRL